MKALERVLLANGNALHIPLPDESIHAICTSPPYYSLRRYDGDQETDWPEVHYSPMPGLPPITIPAMSAPLGLEPTPEAYVGHLVLIWRELWRVLHPSGVCFLNLADSFTSGGRKGHGTRIGYKQRTNRGMSGENDPPRPEDPCGLKPKDMMGIPWRAALALQADGWWLRSDIIWHKTNPMPESVKDRVTRSHEYIFLLAKSERYFYDNEAIKEPIKESSLKRLGRAIGDDRKDSDGYPGQPPHSITRPRPNMKAVKFGGEKADGYGTRLHSGNEWDPEMGRGANKKSVWTLATKGYPGAHYAVWPDELVTPMIKAGASKYGCCPDCLAPWERVLERRADIEPISHKGSQFDNGKTAKHQLNRAQKGPRSISIPSGWQPACDCHISPNGDELDPLTPIPARVLDPFCGSGTTVMVANQLGRVGIGLDLAHTYLRDQAKERTGLAAMERFYGKSQRDRSDRAHSTQGKENQLPLLAAMQEQGEAS